MSSHRENNNNVPNLSGFGMTRPRHSVAYRVSHRLRTAIICVIIALLCFPSTVAAAVWLDLSSIISSRSVDIIAQYGGEEEENGIIDPNAGKPIEVLLIGQDTRDGEGNVAIGGGNEVGLHNSDTTIVVQISADRSWINMVSIPRDSMVDVPSCETTKGTIPARKHAQFNSVFANGYSVGGDLASAASCTLNTVNSLTGLDLNAFVVVDFNGLKNMIDAIGGVDVCIPVDMKDSYTDLNLKKGMNHLDGLTATQYARTRHATGTDGSDTMRTTRQQYLIKQLFNEVKSANLLTQSADLYQLAKAALESLNISRGLADTTTLVGLAMSLANFNVANMYSQTIPITSDPQNPNRSVWTSEADDVWAKMRDDQPLTEQPLVDDSASADPSESTDASTEPEQSESPSESGEPSESTSSEPQPDPVTGLITQEDGTLIDPATGGIVDPEDGTIRNAATGQFAGIADRYVNAVICGTSAQ